MKSLPGILLGIAAGVVVGVLLAPQSGKKTREGLVSDTDNFFSDLQDQLQDGLESIRKQYNDYVETATDKSKSVAADAKRRAKF
ncbi:MAG: YtxH domain-containing protein [Cytophagaceae bacterium]|nr:MAG: YtxH domain-containing protein [Cytophagaceae bacterium]